MDPTYGNALRNLITDPNSFKGTPGFQFALQNGLNSTARASAAGGMGGSGNALAALTKYGTGLASQNYMDYANTLGGLSGQEERYGLGQEQNANAANRNANDLQLGLGHNANELLGINNQYTLGRGQLANAAQRNSNDFGLGMFSAGNQLELGQEQNANNAQRNWWDYTLGGQRNANDAANNENNFNLNTGRNAIDLYNAQTQRGNVAGNLYNEQQRNSLARTRYFSYPRQGPYGP